MIVTKKQNPVTVDFETFGIEGRPDYPPRPVGVSIKYPGKAAKYYAFGHPTKNNCKEAEAKAALKKVYDSGVAMLFQNAKFDLDVAEVHWGLKIPEWQRIHDTMFLLYLDDPHQTELGLKPSSERILGMPPEEQDAVADWLLEHQPIADVKISVSKNSDHYFGRYIAYAPGDIVGKYANGDVVRTEKLFGKLYPDIIKRKMGVAYDRERKLLPILLEMERQGLPINVKALGDDIQMYKGWLDKINAWIIKTIKADKDINLDSGAQLIDAMIKSGKADESQMPLTKTGKIQTNKDALLMGVSDKVLLGVLKYRTQLNTCLNTFMEPWYKVSLKSGGLIYTTWNQIKSPKGASNVGTRTGRLSSTPNFQNIPKEFNPIFDNDAPGKKLPKVPAALKSLPRLPLVRSYVVPFKGDIFIDRDYSQQEPRILAHFDGGQILEKYLENPWIDFHDFARDELAKMGKIYDRKPVKNTNLGLIYGMGSAALALRNDMSVDESNELKKSIMKLYPGLKEMYSEMKARAKVDLPIYTWGGRQYYCEPAKLINGRLQTFDYKMVNVLVQGSAADCTKEAIIRFYEVKNKSTKIILNVHDQITASTPIKIYKQEMEKLRQCMESIEFDVPMLSEGSVSDKSWEDLKDYDKKGKLI